MTAGHGGGPEPPGGGTVAHRPGGGSLPRASVRASRSTAGRPRLTSRAAVLAVVLCAIALSLAYPVREFIAQHRQIAQLEAQHRMEQAQVRSLEAQRKRLSDPAYVKQQARARLNMCMPAETCYVIVNGRPGSGVPHPPPARRSAWYVMLWKSVQQADHPAARP